MGLCLKIAKRLLVFFFCSTLLAVVALKFMPVYYTPLMFIRVFEQIANGEKVKLKHHWVPMEKISSSMPRAVVASEDNLFLTHHGFDIKQIQAAQKEAARGKRQRGASTISQQTAKNVFLWPGHSWIRKGLEAYFTVLIEWVWGKERIMEVYLNSIEMGDGIYGVDAVAKEHFGTDAGGLTKAQSALIAASLPNPRRFNSASPSKYMYKRQQQILRLMRILPAVKFE